jgi:threonine dehydrogenase-like Zn-dependent dehydrogenase
MTPQELPKTHRALVLTSTNEPPQVKIIPTPQPGPGSVVIRVLVSKVLSYSKEIYDGTRPYSFPKPLVIGSSSIGRVAATGPDTTAFAPGQLVFVDGMIRARDNPSSTFLLGIHEGFTEGSKMLMKGEWRDATYAEYAKIPLENCYALNEERLCGELGYKIENLNSLTMCFVPYGGLSDIEVKAGETIIVAPATGPFGGAAVEVALAMGARVIAMGRNIEVLKRIQASHPGRVEIVQMSGDMQNDLDALKKFGTIDAYFDISPTAASGSTHFKSCILALRHGGRVSLMGGLQGDISIPLGDVMFKDLMLKGRWMYDRQNVWNLIKMVETGVLKLDKGEGHISTRKFGLEEWDKAFNVAAEGSGTMAMIAP